MHRAFDKVYISKVKELMECKKRVLEGLDKDTGDSLKMVRVAKSQLELDCEPDDYKHEVDERTAAGFRQSLLDDFKHS